MPKAKPTQVIVHRIELQEKERDMMEVLVAGKTAKNILEPAIAVGGVWIAYKTAKSIHGWGEDWYDRINNRLAILNMDKEGSSMDWAKEDGQPWWKAFDLRYILGFEK